MTGSDGYLLRTVKRLLALVAATAAAIAGFVALTRKGGTAPEPPEDAGSWTLDGDPATTPTDQP